MAGPVGAATRAAPRAAGSAGPGTHPDVQAAQRAQDVNRFSVTSGHVSLPQKVVVFGSGGVGKSTLAALSPRPCVLDIEGSTNRLNVDRIRGIQTWSDLRACLQSNALDGHQTVVIDSVTKAEELAVAHVLATVKHEKGHSVSSLEGYGFGKGARHLYDVFLHLLSDCERHIRAGRNVVLVAHDCTAEVPNPGGEDFLQYQMRLATDKKGSASIRSKVFEWADHVLFVGFDVVVNEHGKGKGAGTRTIWTSELPTHKAKVRDVSGAEVKVPDSLQFENETDGAIWPLILRTGGDA
jgi:hypothetical protein